MKTLKCAAIVLAASSLVTALSLGSLFYKYSKASDTNVVALGTCSGSGTEELQERLAAVSAMAGQLDGASDSPRGMPIEAQTYPFEDYTGPRVAAIVSDEADGKKGGTGFLLQGGYVGTAAHVLPQEISYSELVMHHKTLEGAAEYTLEQGNIRLYVGEMPSIGYKEEIVALAQLMGHAKEAKVAKGHDVALVYVPEFKNINTGGSFKLGNDAKRGDSVTVLTIHPSSRNGANSESELPLLFSEISRRGSVLFGYNGKVITSVKVEGGYSGSPVYSGGSVIGILTSGRRPSFFTEIEKLGPLLASERASLEACLANAPRN